MYQHESLFSVQIRIWEERFSHMYVYEMPNGIKSTWGVVCFHFIQSNQESHQ